MRSTLDLRLAGVAAGAWLAAVTALYLSAWGGAMLAGGAALVAAVATMSDRWMRNPAWLSRAVGIDMSGLRWIVIAVMIGVVMGAAATASRVVVRQRQPVAGLARSHATVTAMLTVTSDPHPVGATHIGPPTYALDATASDIETATLHVGLDEPVFVLASGAGWAGLLPGQRVRVHGRLGEPEPRGLDAALLSVNTSPTLVGRPPWTQRAAGSLREGLQRACDDLSGPVRGLLPGLIDGDTSRLDPAVSGAFRTTGMTHLVAVSGSNVVMILDVVLFVARWCRAGPAVTAVLCSIALVGFVILVRPSPSVLRAAAMGGLGLIGLATGRTRAALPALATVIIALIVYDPALATDVGFGLSVFATAGLLLIAPGWRDALRRRRVPAALAEAIAVPAAAQVACSPMIAGISGTVSLIAVPANLLAVPAVPLATIIGVCAAVLSPIWMGGAAFCAWLASWPARWLLLVAERGAQAPSAVASWPSGVWGALAMTGLLGGALFTLRYRKARVVAVVSLVAAVVGVVPVKAATAGWPPAGALLVVCDVGQGDGMVLPVGNSEGVVVDSGPEPTAIDGCLRRLGIDDVPLLFFTHFHEDHVGGIAGVLDGRHVGAIVTSPFSQPPEGYRSVVTAAAARRIPISVPSVGEVYSVGSLRLTVLGPVSRLAGTRSDPNNNSIVMRADEAGLRLLLTGDAEVEEQAEVLAAAGAAALRCDVLKVPHHGSSYQDRAFLAAAAPSVALVSVGAVNPYGLPNVPILDRLTAAGARVLRTDQKGDLATLSVSGRLAVEFRGQPPGARPP